MRDEGAQLVEVPPPEEFAGEHIAGALNIPLKRLDAETTAGLDRGRPVIVYCHDARSAPLGSRPGALLTAVRIARRPLTRGRRD